MEIEHNNDVTNKIDFDKSKIITFDNIKWIFELADQGNMILNASIFYLNDSI